MQLIGWPFVIPLLVTLVSYMVATINSTDQELLVSKEDYDSYVPNTNDPSTKIQRDFFFKHLSYFFLSNAIWGISTVNVNFQSNEIQLYSSFVVIYIILLMWSVVIILHSSSVKSYQGYKKLQIHSYVAITSFIIIRVIVYLLSNQTCFASPKREF